MSTVLKWLGGKATIIDEIKKVIPEGKRLIEPFAGSCSVMMNTDFEHYIIADINPDLIALYQSIKIEPERFISISQCLFHDNNNEIDYYRLRDVFNLSSGDLLTKSAIFLYLNRHGYRGLCRYNKSKGFFNTPYGNYKSPYFPEKEIYALHEKLKSTTILCGRFQDTLSLAMEGDVVYCDPPYVNEKKFTSYHTNGFTMKEQQELVAKLKELSAQNICVVASSHDNEDMRLLYSDFSQSYLSVRRRVGVDVGKAKHAPELIAYHIPVTP